LAIVATLARDELQWLFSVMSCELPSLNVPTAANCCVLPKLHVTLAGEIASDDSVPVPTVSVVVPDTPEADAVMVTDPPFLPCAIPLDRTEAIFGFDDFQLTPARFPPVLPSLKVPVAVNLIEVRAAILGFAGVMLMPTRCAVDTVRPVDPLIAPKAAPMVVLPVATLVATPLLPIVATAGVEELQTTDPEISCVLLSLNDPVAVNCLVVPVAIVEFAGVTVSDTRLAPVTVSDAVPLTDPLAAVIVVEPAPVLVASPVASTVATEPVVDDQVTDGKACVLPSSKLPTALNCSVVPSAIDGFAGLTEIEIRCAATTVNTVLSLSAPTVAVIVVEPAATVVVNPDPSTVATEAEDEFQVTPLLKSELEPSLYVAVATNCCSMPIPKVRPTGVTAIDTSVGAVTVSGVVWVIPARLAEIFVVPVACELASPLELMVAIDVVDDFQETTLVRSELLPSL